MEKNEKLDQRINNIYDSLNIKLYFLHIELLEIDNKLLQRDLVNNSSIPPHWYENNAIEKNIDKVNKDLEEILNDISIEGIDEIIKKSKKSKPELIDRLLEVRYNKIGNYDKV